MGQLLPKVSVQVVKVHTFPEVFDVVRKFLRLQNRSGTLLVISRDMRSDSYVGLESPETLARAITRTPADAHIVINLSRLTENLKKE